MGQVVLAKCELPWEVNFFHFQVVEKPELVGNQASIGLGLLPYKFLLFCVADEI